MGRVPASLLVALALCGLASAQELPVLHLKVTALDMNQRAAPVARYALLISDNPVTAAPRRVVTSVDGTTQVRLRPGRYTVESDRPLALHGRTYEWVQTVDIPAGRDTNLELTAANATVGLATAEFEREAAAAARSPMTPEAAILTTWQASTFALWTPLRRAAGFLTDDRGLVATSRRGVGDAKTVEVQISETLKVTGLVVASDAATDVALVRVHPSAVAGVRPIVLACDAVDRGVADSDRYLIEVPLAGPKDVRSLHFGSPEAAGGPVFAGDGRAVGLVSPAGDPDQGRRGDVRMAGAAEICALLTGARQSLDANAPPPAAHLPVEPLRPTVAAVAAGATGLALSLAPYQQSSSDFDVTFLTRVVLAAAEGKRGWTGGPTGELNGLRLATDFENWSDYVAHAPPMLFVRVTPRLVEGFWMKVARGAASTQGAQIPPIRRLRPGFSRMRLLCGSAEVTPIHPFRIQTRVTDTEAIEEGLYVFSPEAIGPHCGTVSLVLSSVRQPDKTETRIVDPAIVGRIWNDFRTGPLAR